MGVAAPEAKSPPAKSSRWLSLIISTFSIGLVVCLSYYGMQYFRSSTFSDERAFRVLRELTGQFGNFQAAIAGLGTLVSGETNDTKARERLLRTVALDGQWQLDVSPCAAPAEPVFEIETASAGRPFKLLIPCSPEGSKAAVKLSDSLTRQLPAFASQQFFDVVVLALKDGSVLASIPPRTGTRGSVSPQEAGTEHLAFASVRTLIRPVTPGRDSAGKDAKQTVTDPDPAPYPTVSVATIGGETFRVFVQPFEPAYALSVRTAGQSHLYLVGIKKQDTFRSLLGSLGATGALLITLLGLLVVLAWPLASLRFSAPQEPIGSTQVFAATVALLLIPAVVAVAGFSIWSRHRLVLWTDQSAEVYAREVESTLLSELSDGARVLDDLASQYLRHHEIVKGGTDSFVVTQKDAAACLSPKPCAYPFSSPRPRAGLPENWSTMRIVAPLNLEGKSAGLTLNLFGGEAPQTLDLADREYFKAIRHGQEWHPDELWVQKTIAQDYLPAHGVFAQRLFNRSDAARVLQIAVPMQQKSEYRRDARIRRIGVLTADTKAYGLTASVRPPLLRFAIVESASGEVLFHSDDTRSLAENLLVETERNQALSEAMRKRASRYSIGMPGLQDHFNGRYLGQSHRFHYRPVAGVPWGIVVFYPTDSLAEAVLQTAVATLATGFVFVAVVVFILGIVILLLPGRPDLDLLALMWPRWSWRELYRAMAPCMAIAALAAALLVIVHLRSNAATAVLLVAIAIAVCGVLTAAWRRSASAAPIDARSYEKHYVCCLLSALCIISVVPTVWLASDYHDTSMAALIRDEMQEAADDAQFRMQVIAHDLERLTDGVDVTTRLQQARLISDGLRVPGFNVKRGRSGGQQWVLSDARPGLWLGRCGPPEIDSIRKTIWTFSTSQQAQRQRRNTTESSSERSDDRRDPAAATAAAGECTDERVVVRYGYRGDDSQRFSVMLPLRNPNAREHLQPDAELAARYAWSSWVMFIFVGVVSLMVLTLLCWHAARRLFAIRIPFSGRFTVREANALELGPLVDAELELLKVRKRYGNEFTSKDEADWRAINCRPLYDAAWKAVERKEERVLLHQLARGYFANPENRTVIESLLRRNYLKLWPWPRIVEAGFAEYIRTLDSQQDLAELRQETSQNLWHRIRTPLLLLIVVGVGLLMWLAGSAMQILSATLAGIGALFSSITQVANFGRKDK